MMDKETGPRHFTDLLVWQKAQKLFVQTARDVEGFPNGVAGRLVARQLVAAVGSIAASIAEGFDRHGVKDYINYLRIARGSAHEAQDWYLKTRDLRWLGESEVTSRLATCTELVKMLNSMIGKLGRRDGISSRG
jgi:four helix bundle protein